jgi:hypothetical protein
LPPVTSSNDPAQKTPAPTEAKAPADEGERVFNDNDNEHLERPKKSDLASVSPVCIRKGTSKDFAIIRTDVLNALTSHASWFAHRVNKRILRAKLDALLLSPRWQLLVCCPIHEPIEVMGAILYRMPATAEQLERAKENPPITALPLYPQLAWIFALPKYRRIGVATALLKHAGLADATEIECAFMMPGMLKRLFGNRVSLRYKPYLPDCEILEAFERGEY